MHPRYVTSLLLRIEASLSQVEPHFIREGEDALHDLHGRLNNDQSVPLEVRVSIGEAIERLGKHDVKGALEIVRRLRPAGEKAE